MSPEGGPGGLGQETVDNIISEGSAETIRTFEARKRALELQNNEPQNDPRHISASLVSEQARLGVGGSDTESPKADPDIEADAKLANEIHNNPDRGAQILDEVARGQLEKLDKPRVSELARLEVQEDEMADTVESEAYRLAKEEAQRRDEQILKDLTDAQESQNEN